MWEGDTAASNRARLENGEKLMSASGNVIPRPAAVVVLLRDLGAGLTVFLVRRHTKSTFMPDVFVFPGGSVALADSEAELQPRLCTPAGEGPTGLGRGLRVAALRECFEEAGVLMARRDGELLAIGGDDVERFAIYRSELHAGAATLVSIAARERLTLATDQLVYWAHWITPEGMSKRFDTYFFLAAMPHRQNASHDRVETTAGLWTAPEEALVRCNRGVLPLSEPTMFQLRDLIGLATTAEALHLFRGQMPRTIRPTMDEVEPGVPWPDSANGVAHQ